MTFPCSESGVISSFLSGSAITSISVSPEALLLAKFHQGLLFIKSKQQNFWRDYADAQARLRLCCLHMSEGPFSHDAAHGLRSGNIGLQTLSPIEKLQ